MYARARLGGDANNVTDQMPGMMIMSQEKYASLTTVGDGTITAQALISGIINRTGPTGAYADTLPTVAQLIAAVPQLSVGDAFSFIIRNTVAFANTITTNTGWTLGSNTAIAASLVREFLVTISSNKPTVIFSATTTNASKVLSALTDDAIKALQPGMIVTGTGIGASAKIVAVNGSNNTVTVDVDSTATATNIAVTANPTATIEGVRSSTL